MGAFFLGLMFLSLVIWLGLLTLRGQFWRSDQKLEVEEIQLKSLPKICAVVPARNEADVIPMSLRSLLLQDYPGDFHIFLVDDQSTDGTAAFAEGVAHAVDKAQQLHIVSGESLPLGWSGKLWAMEQGICKAKTLAPDYFFLTDADIEHDVSNLTRLVAKALQEDLDLASVMVKLRCESFWEKFLIPAFVFFFQKLYPFRWVNNPKNKTAAAAGGCILIRASALEQIGGIQVIRQTLIDDCTLAQVVKGTGNNSKFKNSPSSPPTPSRKIWLGLSSSTRSLRQYQSLQTIWDMVARTAYTQLNYSPWLLLGTVVAMTLIYLIPPVGTIIGALMSNWGIALIGLAAWLLMSLAYFPTIRFYKLSPLLAFSLPAIAFLYTLMTIDSALRHWQGRGGAWKGRVYPG
ncbi:Glycosyl transferase, family 2 [Nostoc sp. NIES-3756]|uniref:glycosyltransferase n=1 Tax=Nostoc sp. NIES-3756 TaxID=1751286 RepID=UPI0007219D7F|nr:glycosyltransferase [Nostoc sp. NIES-3756]BAT51404.1 Glycosyl transferase, family 2 [Nostoc sp. NIES-3756]